MENSQMIKQDKSVLQWGGLAGIIGGILFILSMVVAEVLIPTAPANLTDLVARYPSVHILRVAENGIFLIGLILGVPLFLALFWAIKKTSLAPALFGSALGIVGIISMAVATTPHVAHFSLSELYQSPSVSPEAQATLGLMWEATWGLFNAPLYVGFLVGMIGFTLVGIGMFGSQNFGKGVSWVIVVLGAAGIVAALLQMIDPASFIGIVPFFAYIIFYFVLGIKVYKLSKSA